MITLWLANAGCGHFCRILSERICIETKIILHNPHFYIIIRVENESCPHVAGTDSVRLERNGLFEVDESHCIICFGNTNMA